MSFTTLSDGLDPRPPARLLAGGQARGITKTANTGSVEPVEKNVLINFLRTDVERGGEVEGLGKSVRERIERYLEMALLPSSVTVLYDGPAIDCRLPFIPFTSFTTVKEVIDGVAGDDISGSYYVQGDRLRRNSTNAVAPGKVLEVVYVAGYANGQCPEDIKLAIRQLTADAFTDRGATIIGSIASPIKGAGLSALDHYLRP